MRAVFVAIISKFQSGDFGDRTSNFDPKGLELKIHIGVELDPQVGKSSFERLRLAPIPQDKKQTDDQNQNTLKLF